MDHPAEKPPHELAAQLRAALIGKLGEERFNLWFERNTIIDCDPRKRTVTIAVSSEYYQDWIIQTFGSVIRDVAHILLGVGSTVDFRIEPDRFGSPGVTEPVVTSAPIPTAKKPKSRRTLFGDEVAPPPAPEPTRSRKNAPTGKGRQYRSLKDFVVGTTNRVAHAAALSLIEDEGQGASPLVLYGSVGTGKTHLLEGIYLGLKEMRGEGRPCFITAADFTAKFVQASRYDKHAQFRRQFRDCSALLIDDLHFLATKPATQKEFIQTLDSLTASGRQVVITTDCHPRLADEFLPELVDRLLAGVAWALQPPDEATRLKILKSKASAARLSVPEAILKMVASKLHGNVRELEGAINSLAHYSRLEQRPVDMPLAREALGELLRHSVRTISIGDIDRAVCVVLKLSAGKLQSGARAWAISHPRMIASYLCRKHTAATYGEIAKHFGSRTHSTAVAAEKKVRGWLEKKQSLPMGDREWNVPELIEKIERELLR